MDEIDKIEIKRQDLIRAWGAHNFLAHDVPFLIDTARGILTQAKEKVPDEDLIVQAFKHVVKRRHMHDPKGCSDCFNVEVAAEKVK